MFADVTTIIIKGYKYDINFFDIAATCWIGTITSILIINQNHGFIEMRGVNLHKLKVQSTEGTKRHCTFTLIVIFKDHCALFKVCDLDFKKMIITKTGFFFVLIFIKRIDLQ